MSISWIVVVKPRGPHQWATCFGSVHASQTSSRGWAKTRERTMSRSSVATVVLLLLQVVKVVVETVETLLPEAAVSGDPEGRVLERARAEPARPPLRPAPPDDQPRPLEDLQVLGDGR